MLVKPFSASVSRERPQSRISLGGTSVCTGTLTRCTETLAGGDNESARRPLIDLPHNPHSSSVVFRIYRRKIYLHVWTLEEKSCQRRPDRTRNKSFFSRRESIENIINSKIDYSVR